MTTTQSVPARPSATIVMLRDSQRGPEILMVRRRAGDAFGESFTFPGGVLDADESRARDFCDGISAVAADALLNVPDAGLDFYSAVIRELFEETGILLARRSGDWVTNSTALQTLRKQVHRARLAWPDFLREQEMRMACDAIHYFAHWETPLSLPKRWTTRFFMARLPDGQDATHDNNELTEIRWLTVAEALSAGRSGEMLVPFPTFATLKSLAESGTVAELLDWAEKTARDGVEKILPVEKTQHGKREIVVPVRRDSHPRNGDV